MEGYKPTREEFLAKAKLGNLIPVYRTVLADLETPVSAFNKLADDEFAFLLDSVEGGEKLGRYSFLGSNPSIIFKSRGPEVDINYYHLNEQESLRHKSPLQVLRKLMKRFTPVMDPALPPFIGGAVGYMAYDAIRYFEAIPDNNPDELKLPDLFFMITDTIIIFDHVKRLMTIVSNAQIKDNPEKAYDEAVHKIDLVYERLLRPRPMLTTTFEFKLEKSVIESNFSQPEFEQAVEKARDYVFAGDIFQVVLSQRLKTKIGIDDFDIYRALRAINPSPYMFYLKFGGLKLIGSSPEILVKLTGDTVCVRPIAGTRHRGTTLAEDEALTRDLLADPKERAEHIMLVDLGRNDCGRVSQFGTVRVSELMVIEKYSHVMHIVSNVIGKLRQGYDCFDALAATFPAGTVTGAPKIRAMEIIDELEPVRRGPYAGAVGYFSFSGNLDSCITIRTIMVKENEAYIQVGAGIVADSVPEKEYQETLNKAQGMLKALEMAQQGL